MSWRHFLVFLFYFVAAEASAQQEDSLIYWREDYKLTWQDFQATKPPAGFSDDDETGAITFSLLKIKQHYDANRKLVFIIRNVFRKKGSWVQDSLDVFSSGLLEHEQLHFDIGEVYARKMRCRVLELENKYGQNEIELKKEVKKEITKLVSELNERHDAYDKETSHGTIREKQKEWMTTIRAELKQLETYQLKAHP